MCFKQSIEYSVIGMDLSLNDEHWLSYKHYGNRYESVTLKQQEFFVELKFKWNI